MGFWDFFRRRSNVVLLAAALTIAAGNVYIHNYWAPKKEANIKELKSINTKMRELQLDKEKKVALLKEVEEMIIESDEYEEEFTKLESTLRMALDKLKEASFKNHIKVLRELKIQSEDNEALLRMLEEKRYLYNFHSISYFYLSRKCASLFVY